MAEDKTDKPAAEPATPPEQQSAAAAQSQAAAEPQLQMVGQYIKDLSFENPGVGKAVQRPQIEFNVDLHAQKANEATANQYEIEMKMRVHATDESKPMFLLELVYAGIFVLNNVPEDSVQPVVLIECPRLLFPFARRIIADVVRDGGLPPLMIEPIDFAALYRRKIAETAGQRAT